MLKQEYGIEILMGYLITNLNNKIKVISLSMAQVKIIEKKC
jgi:hypothetical protein